MAVIEIKNLTKEYDNQKGIFDISLSIEKGEVYGFLGPNGAGKSTTMRHLMGFIHPDKGAAFINGLDCQKQQKRIQQQLGYLPGEISFFDEMTGIGYLEMIANMRHCKDMEYAQELLTLFEIDPNANLKRMSKGMKQKIGIVAAFMHDPEVILLDEPTSGLDPLMQNRFLELIEKEKQKGKTILMSSHIFEEVERTCNRIGIIKNGKIIQEIDAKQWKESRIKSYLIGCSTQQDIEKIEKQFENVEQIENTLQIIVSITDTKVNDLIQTLSTCSIRFLKEQKHTLEEYFMKFYGGNNND